MHTNSAAYNRHIATRSGLRLVSIFAILICVWAQPLAASVFDHDPLARYAVEQSRHLWHGRQSLAPIEGVWMTSAGAYIAIRANGINSYEMTVIHTPDLSIAPGTVMGSAHISGKMGMYDASIFRDFTADGKGHRPQRLAITVDISTGMMRFDPYKQGWRVNLRRLIPYLFRFSVQREDTRPDGLEGAMRIYPTPPPTQQNPIEL